MAPEIQKAGSTSTSCRENHTQMAVSVHNPMKDSDLTEAKISSETPLDDNMYVIL